MGNTMDFRDLGEGIGDATAVVRTNAAVAGLDAPVPTCPGWTVRDLVTHQGMVHRWAAAIVRKEEPRSDGDVAAEAVACPDLLEWLDDGMVELLNGLAGADEDLDVPFFLPDAPPPRQAWARRQCHETTIHGIDAMAARLGRAPVADELWFVPALARDGIDELLLGFAPRAKYSPRWSRPASIAVRTDDGVGTWTITMGPDGTKARVGGSADPDASVSGAARDVYLGLWRRGGSIVVDGEVALVDTFLDQLRVT